MNLKNEAIEQVLQLPISRNNGTSNHWDIVSQDIRQKILSGDIDNFLRWKNIIETMYIDSKSVAEYEYEHLKKSKNWKYYKDALEGLWVGNPTISEVMQSTNNNALHQMYHLSLFEDNFGSILNSNKIIEFGGGYGCLCSLIRRLGFTGEYIIIDFPEFHIIQKYYLNCLDIYNFKQTTYLESASFNNATLFAFWSLSETEPEFRKKFINENFNYLKNFLISYQEVYENYDNMKLFELLKRNDSFKYKESHIEHIPQNYYIFGEKK